MSEREPDHTDDPRQGDTGNQLPEDQPEAHTGSEGEGEPSEPKQPRGGGDEPASKRAP